MQAQEAAIWGEWKKITRFLESSRIAFQREEMICSSFEIPDMHSARFTSRFGISTFQISLHDHIKTLQDESVLFSVVLTSSYTLVESFARVKLGIQSEEDLCGGIEVWGTRLLGRTGHEWSKVTGGKQGLIEVAVARNAISHGIKKINQTMVSRFISSGCISPWQIGESVTLDYQKLDDYRARLKSLMRFSDNVKRRAK